MICTQDKQNFPILELLVSNINQNSFQKKNLNYSETQEIKQNNLQSCSKHSQKKGQYFESQHPWIKFCENCALNLALCGKRIQKSLTSDQMYTKITLCNTLEQLSQSIKLSQQAHQQFSTLSTQLQQCRQYFVNIMNEIDTFVSKLTEIKVQLEQKVQLLLSKQIKEIFQKQSLIISKKIELLNQKTRIQCGFMEIVGKQKANQSANETISNCKRLLNQIQSLFIMENYKTVLTENIKSVQKTFEENMQKISSIQIKNNIMQYNQRQAQRPSVVFSNRIQKSYSKKNRTQLDQSMIQHNIQQINQNGSNFTTTCSASFVNSGMASPNNQLIEGALQEITQNRRSSRATLTLQLKSRCRSKSGQKKIQVNVRQDKQKRSKI